MKRPANREPGVLFDPKKSHLSILTTVSMELFNFEYNYNFSLLSAIELQRDKINHGEIISVFENPLTIGEALNGFPSQGPLYSLVGFSAKKRFLLVALEYYNDTVIFLQIQVADE